MKERARGQLDGTEAPLWLTSWWLWSFVAAAIFVTAVLGVGLRPEGGNLAVWWPAAGVAALFLLASPRERRPLSVLAIFVATTLANLAGGRDLDISIVFGVANTAEAVVFVWVLHRSAGRFVLRTVGDSFRFIVAAVAGAATIGIIAGLGVYLFEGGSFLTTALHAFPSHAAAILMIAPFGALPSGRGEPIRWGEAIVQSLLLAAAVILVFGVDTHLPMAFVPLGLLAWGAFRLPTAVTFIQSAATAVAIVLFSLAGLGAFADPTLSPDEQATTIVAFLLVLGAFILIFVSGQTELSLATRRASNAAELLSSGFIDSDVALALITERGGIWHVMWANRAATQMLGDELAADDIWRGELRDAAADALARGEVVSLAHPQSGASLNLVASFVERDRHRISLQIVDITDALRATERQLEAERERAAALATRLDLERQREDFLATTSHELRTPLMSISGYTELLADTPGLPDDTKQWLDIIQRNSERLAELIESLVIAGSPVGEPTSASFETFDARGLLSDVLATHHARAQSRNITLVLGEAQGVIRASRGEIGRALTSLVSNAIKFTPPGGTVHAEAAHTGALITLTITDTGPGISPESMPFVFQRFYRAPEAERDSTPGTGLGLSIAQQLTHRNGGTISLTSPPHGGLVATLRLPGENDDPGNAH